MSTHDRPISDVGPSAVGPSAEGNPPGGRRQTLEVPGKPPTANQLYSQGHWAERNRLKNQWHEKTQWLAASAKLRAVEHYPVVIGVRVFFGKGQRRYDPDNLQAVAKLITDALVEAGILENDSPRYVEQVRLGPCLRSSTGDPYTEYTIIEPTIDP